MLFVASRVNILSFFPSLVMDHYKICDFDYPLCCNSPKKGNIIIKKERHNKTGENRKTPQAKTVNM